MSDSTDFAASERRARIYALFDAAMDLQADAREKFLQTQCSAEPQIEVEVRALLDLVVNDTESTLGLLNLPPEAPAERLVGRQFGRFKLVELIGAGGMGVVYRAERIDDVKQAVAIKLLAGEISSTDYARLEREAQMLARVEHSAVARLIDTGVQDGRGWIALEFVRGQPIDAYCESRRLAIRERVRLLAMVVDAVATAHSMLVVHRDIKPANVLMSDEGLPKLIDFGISANLTSALAAKDMTADIGRLFTPHYAAPEQVAGQPVTVATDVFGLGALCYRVLCGAVPYANAPGAIRYMLAITRQDVDLPSRAAQALNDGPAVSDLLRGDLDAILIKALARNPEQRYRSAAELGADLQRYLHDLPVRARRASLWYRSERFVRRHRGPVIAGALLCLCTSAAAIVYAVQVRTISQARAMAAHRSQFLESMIKSADPRNGRRDVTVAELLDAAAKQSDRELAEQPLVAASMLGVLATINADLRRFVQALAANERQITLLRRHSAPREDLADALVERGALMNSSARYPQAEPYLREAIGLLSARCRADGRYLQSLDQLSESLARSSQATEAARVHAEALECRRRLGFPMS